MSTEERPFFHNGKYDYREAVKSDIIDYLRENKEDFDFENDRDEIEEQLYDDLFVRDSVTGNASGSYFCNTWKAEECLCHNLDLLGEALAEFCCGPEYMMEKGAEACDVTIRCYLLSQMIPEAIDEFLEGERQDMIYTANVISHE